MIKLVMKKRVMYSLVILFFILTFPLIFAENVTVDSEDANTKVQAAYTCLNDKIDNQGCSDLSSEERIFSLLAVKECKSQVLDDAKNDKCWPESSCKIKTTAQAILALSKSGTNTDEADNWLLSQNMTPPDVVWYLQIESNEATNCTIKYGSTNKQISIGEDRKIDSNAGSCLTKDESGYWYRVSTNCYEQDFEISCDENFLTSLLYKKKTSSTIYVSEQTNSASSEGTTTEKVNSLCFEEADKCSYEGSLWAALVLKYKGYDVSAYLPYLISMAEDNDEYLPESFLYLLTGYEDYRTDLLLRQKTKYWDESGDKFYDTAIALYPFSSEEPTEKSTAMEWLLEDGVQDKDGCWKGNLRNTAFLLYSVWPKSTTIETDTDVDCETSGYFCMSAVNCEGNILNDYSCAGVLKCCDKEKSLETCVNQGGSVCTSSQNCVSGTIGEASGLSIGEKCCLGGTCEDPVTESECESRSGICRSFDCSTGEELSAYSCDYGQNCCVKSTKSETSYWWIWVLLILIVLIALAILYKDKVKIYWFRIKSNFRKSGGSSTQTKPSTGFPPRFPPEQRMMQRRILPPNMNQNRPMQRPVTQNRPNPKSQEELNDVLKKLKEMGR